MAGHLQLTFHFMTFLMKKLENFYKYLIENNGKISSRKRLYFVEEEFKDMYQKIFGNGKE